MSGVSAGENGPILVGFSGGGDSRALLQQAIDSAAGTPVLACVVDHGIRAGSKDEAERAAAMAREAGAEAHVLTLNWPADANPSQAAARTGRTYALTAFARAHGTDAIFLAHTMDDQAETVLMRTVQGSGWRGLAGMAADAPAPLWPGGRGLRVRRPMLRTRRVAVRAALRARAIEWIDDPSNEAERFLRVRARRRLAAWGEGVLGVERWAGLAARIAPVASALDRAARALIAEAAAFSEGTVKLSVAAYGARPLDVRLQALAAILMAASGAGGVADWDGLERLDGAILAGQAKGGTLGGARYWASGGDMAVARDPGAVLGRAGVLASPPEPLKLGQQIVWDGRVALTAREVGWEAAPGPDGTLPVLLRPRTKGRLTITEGVSQGIVEAQWLLQERISHLLWR